MIKSMTGYGRAHKIVEGRSITVEIKSVNHRYLDFNIKAPRLYGFVEEPLRSLVQSVTTRGKVDIFILIEPFGTDDVSVGLNSNLAGAYINALGKISADFSLSGDISALALARMPDVLSTIKEAPDIDAVVSGVSEVAAEALIGFDTMRTREGENLAKDILSRVEAISSLVEKIDEYSPKSAAAYAERLENRIKEILEGREIDETRLLTEVAVFAERISVAEEIVRLKSHISQLKDMVISGEPVGRKMDFLIQEFNREINTIGSKSSDIEATKIVVDLKAEIEKIREQIQNIE